MIEAKLFTGAEMDALFPELHPELHQDEGKFPYFRFVRQKIERGYGTSMLVSLYEDGGTWILKIYSEVPLERLRDIEDIVARCRRHAETHRGDRQ